MSPTDGDPRPPVCIRHDGGSVRTLFFDYAKDGTIHLAVASQGAGTFRYEFDARTGAALSRELQVECEGEATKGPRRGDLRQLTLFNAPAVYTEPRRKTKWIAVWRIDPEDLRKLGGGE